MSHTFNNPISPISSPHTHLHTHTQVNTPETWSAISYLPHSLRESTNLNLDVRESTNAYLPLSSLRGRDSSTDERERETERERERERENFGLPREREREREREAFGLPNALRSDSVHELTPVPLINVHMLKSTLHSDLIIYR
jgi:hypothetical protein